MKAKLALLSVAVTTVALFLSRAKAKGMDEEIGKLVSQILGLIKDRKYPSYRLHKTLGLTVEVLENEKKGVWSAFNLEGRGRDRFKVACLSQMGAKALKASQKPSALPKGNPLNCLQPELTFLKLLEGIREIENKKRPPS